MPTLGLHVDGARLMAVLVKKRRGKPEILFSKEMPLKEAPLFVKQLDKEVKGLDIAVGIDALVRPFSLQLSSKRVALKALPFQIESALPLPLEEVHAHAIFHKGGKKEVRITLFAARKEGVESAIGEWNGRGIDPDRVSCTPQALLRFVQNFFPHHESVLFFFVGKRVATFGIVEEGHLMLSKRVELGSAEEHEGAWPQEMERILAFLQKKKRQALEPLYFGDIPQKLQTLLEESFGKMSGALPPCASAAPACGLALDALLQDRLSVDFRQGGSKRARKRLKLLRSLYVAAAVALSAVFAGGHALMVQAKKGALEKHLHALLGEKVELSEGLALLEKRASTPSFAPKEVGAPKVSAVLQWIGTHPLLSQGGIEITRVHYTLENYPKLGEKTGGSVASVELELTSTSPTKARDFHASLLKGDALVDARKEIVWKANNNSFFTKFYIRPHASS